MPSTREPIQLLEPSDLLEPLDLTDDHANSVYAPAYPEYGGTANSASARTRARGLPRARVQHGGRALKSALIVAGALACFGAGAALSQFPNVPFVDGNGAPTMAGTVSPPPRAADSAVKPDDPTSSATTNNAQQATTSNQPKQAAVSSAPQQSAAPPVKESAAPAAPACDAQASSKDDTHCLAGATVQPTAASAKPTAASDPIAINTPAATQPVAQAETPPVADRTRADTRASGEKQQRAQSSRSSRRITRRDSADRRAADNTVQSERFFDRWQDREAARWQDRDTGRWQDRDAGRWPDRDADRAYGWRRERYDAYARGDDRGGARAWREDERMNGRPPREEVQPTFAPFRSGW